MRILLTLSDNSQVKLDASKASKLYAVLVRNNLIPDNTYPVSTFVRWFNLLESDHIVLMRLDKILSMRKYVEPKSK